MTQKTCRPWSARSLRPRHGRPGFTLVEMLMVMVIVIILASLALPAILRSRESARGAQCASNLRQLALGAMQFAEANRSYMPYRYEDANHVNRFGVNRPRWQWIVSDFVGRPLQNPDILRAYDAATIAGAIGGYPVGTALIPGYPIGADASVAAGGNATYTNVPMDNEIFLDPALLDTSPRPTASGLIANATNSIRNGAYGYNFQYLGNSRTIDDLGDYPSSPYINFPVGLVKDPSRTICFADSRGGGATHGGHSMTLDPPHQRVHPTDPFSADKTLWGTASPALMTGFDPYGPDEPGTDIAVYFSPAEERHLGRANVVFLDGHVASHTLGELGYVVDAKGVALPHYVADATLNPHPGSTVNFGATAGATAGTVNNVSNNRLFTGAGRDETSAYYSAR